MPPGQDVTFGNASNLSPSTPSLAPNQPTTPTPSGETAGTVESFTSGVLVIKLKDKSTVSGRVTEQTELECRSASSTQPGDDQNDGGGQPGNEQSGDGGQPGDEQKDEESAEHGAPLWAKRVRPHGRR